MRFRVVPGHIGLLLVAVTVAVEFILTVVVAVEVHPPLVTVTV